MPPRAHTIVDPRFGAELRRHREAQAMSLRQLAATVNHGKSLIHQLETGQTRPTATIAARLDDALNAEGKLAALVVAPPDPGELVTHVASHPRRVEPAAVNALGDVLAGYRRLEDSIGSAAVMLPVRAQLDTVVSLLREAGHHVRPAVVDQAAQWAQFAGWLSIATGDDRNATLWLARGLQWATEAGNAELIATILSFQGHHAEGRGHLPEMIGLSRAARRDPAVNATLRAYCSGQEARGLAMADAPTREVVDRLAEAADLAAEAADSPLPPWGYWYTPAFYAVQQGIVWRYLGAHDARANDRAVELLTAGTAGVVAEASGSDWHGRHLLHLAVVHAQAGSRIAARETLTMVEGIAMSTGSKPLLAAVRGTARRLGLSVIG